MNKEKVCVRIYGREYDIDADIGNALYINALARYIEEKMQEIATLTNIVDSSKLAILAALNIADELFHLKESQDTVNDSVNKKTDELLTLLNTELE